MEMVTFLLWGFKEEHVFSIHDRSLDIQEGLEAPWVVGITRWKKLVISESPPGEKSQANQEHPHGFGHAKEQQGTVNATTDIWGLTDDGA